MRVGNKVVFTQKTKRTKNKFPLQGVIIGTSKRHNE